MTDSRVSESRIEPRGAFGSRTGRRAWLPDIRDRQQMGPYLLFALFVFYGPSISIVGELRYVEVVAVALLLFNLNRATRFMGTWDRRFVGLFILTAAVQTFSDVVNGAALPSTFKRAGTYVILALLIMCVRWLGRNDFRRIRLILAGYCLSYVTIMFLGTSTSGGYAAAPWLLGLGAAMTILLCLGLTWVKLPRLYGAGLLFLMAFVHVRFGSRSLGLFVAATAGFTALSDIRAKNAPDAFRIGYVIGAIVVASVAIYLGYLAAVFAVQENWLPHEMQEKMQVQLSSPYGLLAAARPDTAAAVYAITKKPIIGFGSDGFDAEVFGFYADVAASAYIRSGNYQSHFENTLEQDWKLGIPNHSHLFGAWADAGIFATFGWLAVLGLTIYLLSRVLTWNDRRKPLFTFVAIMTFWDVLFSPGPHRMDMAMRLLIMLYAVDVLRHLDSRRRRIAGAPVHTNGPAALQTPVAESGRRKF